MKTIDRYKKIIKLSIPLTFSFLSFQLLGVTDILMVGSLGKDAIAAVGVALTLFYFFAFAAEGMFDGITILISRAFGEGNMQEIRTTIKHGILIAILTGLIGITLFTPLAYMLKFMTSSSIVYGNAKLYLLISLMGLVPQLINGVYIRFFMAVQKNKPVAVISNITVVINILFCYLLIFGNFGFPKLGIAGSAVATLIAKILAMVFSFLYYNKIKKNYMKNTKETVFEYIVLKKVFITGLPVAQTNFLEVSAWTFFVSFISRLGTASMAAHEIGMKIKDVAYLPGAALGIVATTMAGKLSGSKDVKEISKYTYAAMNTAVVVMGVLGTVFFIFPEMLISCFTKDREVLETGTAVLRIMALYQITDAVFIVLRGALNGLNETKFVRNMIMIGSWGIMVPVAFIFTSVFKYGVIGAWIGLTSYVTIIAIVYFIKFKNYKYSN